MTLGGAVGEVARLMGKPFMPWQQYVADVISELDPDTGEFVYSEWGLTVPRQSGKSTFLLAKNVHRASATRFFGAHQQLVYTAQTRKDARLKLIEDFAPTLLGARELRQANLHTGNGDEHLRFPNGSRFGIEANTEKAGHGGTLDEADIDEAFAQVDSRLEQAFEPAMLTRRNTRLGWISTAGWVEGSPFLQTKTRMGREAVALGHRRGLAYFEWSAPDDADPGDPAVWVACMPALRHPGNPGGTIPLNAIQRRYDRALAEGKLNGFRRAYLNQWVPKASDEPPTISDALWASRRDDSLVASGAIYLAVDVTMDRSRAFIAAARGDDPAGVRVVSVCSPSEVVAEVVAFRDGRDVPAVLLDPSSAAGAQMVALESAGVPVETVPGGEVAQACGAFHDGLVRGRYRYAEHEDLTAAVGNAVLRATPRGASRWYPVCVGASVSPLYAVTLAAYGLAKYARPAGDPDVFFI